MSERIHVATRKGLFTVACRAAGWSVSRTAFLGDPVVMVLHDACDDHVYAAIKHGHFGNMLHRSADGGAIWEQVEPPAYPSRPEGAEPVMCPVRNIEIPWNLEMVWELRPDLRSDGALWCGTIPGGLFHSGDRGRTWRLVESLWNDEARRKWSGGGYDYPGIHSILVHPRCSESDRRGCFVRGRVDQ